MYLFQRIDFSSSRNIKENKIKKNNKKELSKLLKVNDLQFLLVHI